MYVPKNRALRYMKQKLIELKGKSKFIYGDINTSLSEISRTIQFKNSYDIKG